MVNYWKSKVLPKIKKVFENPKKVAAAEACKVFDEAKEQYSKEFEDKKTELEPKVIEIYGASSAEIKSLVKDPKDAALKKHSAAVEKFLDELAKIEFPGSKPVCEAATKVGAGYLPGPVFFVLEKVSTFIVVEEEEKKEEAPAAAAEEEEKKEEAAAAESSTAAVVEVVKEKEIVVEPPPPPAACTDDKATEPAAAVVPAVPAAAAAEPPKVEAAAPAAEPPKP